MLKLVTIPEWRDLRGGPGRDGPRAAAARPPAPRHGQRHHHAPPRQRHNPDPPQDGGANRPQPHARAERQGTQALRVKHLHLLHIFKEEYKMANLLFGHLLQIMFVLCTVCEVACSIIRFTQCKLVGQYTQVEMVLKCYGLHMKMPKIRFRFANRRL